MTSAPTVPPVTDPALPLLARLADAEAVDALLARLPWLDAPRATGAQLRLRWKPGTNVRAGLLVPTAAGPAALLVAQFADREKAGALAAGIRRRGAPAWHDDRLVIAPAEADPAVSPWIPPGLVPLAYNPGRRLVGRIGETVVKVHAKPVPRAVRELSRRAAGVAWPDRRVGVSSWVSGRPPRSSDLPSVADAVRALHAGPPPGGLVTLDAGAVLAAVRRAADGAAAAAPHLAGSLHAITDRLGALLPGWWPAPDAVVHGDLSADQVLLRADGTVALLDLDRAARGPAAWDGATWEAAELAAGTALPAPVRAPALLRAAALVQRAPEPFRRMRPGWPALTAALVTGAERALEEVR
ncbi:MAG TPA: hypothetical protein VM367_04670 [Pseudonocardia sp.]|nr:hypothetical protein [Pseudonocardia sp.]